MTTVFRGDDFFLSNFYPACVYCEAPVYSTDYDEVIGVTGLWASSVEHAFQALRSRDAAERQWILASGSPAVAKRRGREVKMLRKGWYEMPTRPADYPLCVRYQTMKRLVAFKFGIPALRAKLLATGERRLVEYNDHHDNTWGICRCGRCGGEGLNWLGEILMAVRAEIQEDLGFGEWRENNWGAVAFTGHRPDAFVTQGNPYAEDGDVVEWVKEELNRLVGALVLGGIRTFITGGAQGVDTWAAEAVLLRRSYHSDVKLHVYIPFPGQTDPWPVAARLRYDRILECANVVKFISDTPPARGDKQAATMLLHQRNRAMMEAAARAVAVWDGRTSGGTAHAVSHAERRRLPLYWIDPKRYDVHWPEDETKPRRLL